MGVGSAVFDQLEAELRQLYGNASTDLFSKHFQAAAKYFDGNGGIKRELLARDLAQTVKEVQV